MKRSYFALFILLPCMLSSCNSSTETITQMSAITEASPIETTSIIEETTLPPETEMPEETIETTIRTQENIDAAWEARLHNNTDVNLSAVKVEDNTITVSDEYPELKTVVEDVVNENAMNVDSNFTHYRITRFDGVCLCFVYEYGTSVTTYNFRLDGTEIELTDVISDLDLYIEAGISIIDSYNQTYFDSRYRNQLEPNEVMENIKDCEWVMDEGAMIFYQYEEKDSLFGIPYRETADLINSEFLPGEQNSYGTSNYGYISCGDNVLLTTDSVVVPYSDLFEFPSINGVRIDYVVDLQSRGYECGYYGYCYPQYLCIDGDSYVYFYAHGMYEGVHFSALYDITSGEPIFVYGSDSESAIDDALDIVSLIS